MRSLKKKVLAQQTKVLTPTKNSAKLFSMMTLEQAWAIVGGLSQPSKMPCYGFSISAKRCKTGKKLRKVPGSICSKCYALKGRYVFQNVQNALERRFAGLSNPLWVPAMSFLVNRLEKSGFFRWFDSGDVQSVEQLEKIVQVCLATPNIQHWLPTREYHFVAEYVKKYGAFPSNLTVRVSAYMIDGAPPVSFAKAFGVVTSGVAKDSYSCPAYGQGGKCLDCRACWNQSVANVNYKLH